jgi:hypothetical protein
VREYIHIGNWILLIILMIYLSFKDVGRIAAPHVSKITGIFKKAQ